MRHLLEYHWPGNVRELENAIERALVLGVADEIQPEDLPETLTEAPVPAELNPGLLPSVADTKRQLVIDAWQQSGGDYKAAAKRLNIHPNSLLRLVRNLGLRELNGEPNLPRVQRARAGEHTIES